MKEFSNIFSLSTGNGKKFKCTKQIDFNQTPNISDAGPYWDQSVRAITLDADILKYNRTRCNIVIYNSDGSVFTLGSALAHPMLLVTPQNRGAYLLEASFESSTPATL